MRYSGNFENWKQIFKLSKLDIPNNIDFNLLPFINVSFHEVEEFQDNDENGEFKMLAERKEFTITFKDDLNQYDCSNLVKLMWFLG